MMNHFKPIGVLAVAATVAVGIASVSAHHSTTMFDPAIAMTISGEVVELRWVKPHVSLSVNGVVKERAEDGPAVWVMEMTSPGNLVRAGGWRRDAVKPGEKVEVVFSPLRDSAGKGGALKKLTVVATGEVFTAKYSRAGAAGARMSPGLRFRPVAALAIGVLIAAPFALGQEPSGPPPKDTIFARKILMGAIDMNMDAIETMLAPNGKLDAAEAQEHADTISIMLMSFPHMFPAGTNQWKAGADRDPATDTYASPEVWANFADFYQRAATASKLAQDASNTKRLHEFRGLLGQLRAACNSRPREIYEDQLTRPADLPTP